MRVSIRYQDYQAEQIPTVEQEGARVRVMAGDSHGATGPVAMRNPGLLLDVTLAKGASFSQEVCGFYHSCRATQELLLDNGHRWQTCKLLLWSER